MVFAETPEKLTLSDLKVVGTYFCQLMIAFLQISKKYP
jgi:hypothetical protein